MSDSSISWWNSMPDYAEGVTPRNMTNGDLFQERAAKTALVVLALLVAIGVAVAIYYCCTSTTKHLGGWEGYGGWETSNAGLSPIPAIPGSALAIGLLGLAVCTRRSKGGSDKETPKLPVN